MGFANTNIGWTLLGWMVGGVVMGITHCHNIMILAVVVMVVELLGGAFLPWWW